MLVYHLPLWLAAGVLKVCPAAVTCTCCPCLSLCFVKCISLDLAVLSRILIFLQNFMYTSSSLLSASPSFVEEKRVVSLYVSKH